MKASLKFREDQKPLVRAKVPLSILGLPFLSAVSAGDSKELALSLATSFDSGPSIKVSYHPNDPWNPFGLAVRTGIGSFGSPISSPLAMTAEFSLLGRGYPTFSLQFKPRIGDFSVKKTERSRISLPSDPTVFGLKIKALEEAPAVDLEMPVENGFSSSRKAIGFRQDLFSGTEVSARSVLPLRSCARLGFRWGFRLPEGVFDGDGRCLPSTAEVSLNKIPLLVMSKISIEHVASDGKASEGNCRTPGADVSEACFSVRRQLEALQAENGLLRKAVEEIRSEIGDGKLFPAATSQRSGAAKKDRRIETHTPEIGGFAGKVTEDDVSDELKTALL